MMFTQRASVDLTFLDGLRGLAAFYVMVGHARWLLWEGYSSGYVKHPGDYSLIGKGAVYGSTFFIGGHEAVMFFFVLSGFVIHLSYARKLSENKLNTKFDCGNYSYRRIKRLYPPLIFSLVLTFLLDRVGQFWQYPIYFQQSPYPSINSNISVNQNWLIALGNLFFVMGTYVPTWGTNGPLWSLKFEWWFYMIYPIFWWLSKRDITLATALMGALFILSFFSPIWLLELFRQVFSAMIIWWFGVLLADIFTERIALSFKYVACLSLLTVVLPCNNVLKLVSFDNTISDVLWGLGFAGIIALCLFIKEKGGELRLLDRLKPLGEMSYTLYIIHFPILVLLSGWLMQNSPNHELPQHFGWAMCGIVISLIMAYFLHLLIEKPFMKKAASPVVR